MYIVYNAYMKYVFETLPVGPKCAICRIFKYIKDPPKLLLNNNNNYYNIVIENRSFLFFF